MRKYPENTGSPKITWKHRDTISQAWCEDLGKFHESCALVSKDCPMLMYMTGELVICWPIKGNIGIIFLFIPPWLMKRKLSFRLGVDVFVTLLKPYHHDPLYPIAVLKFFLTNQQKDNEICTNASWLLLLESPWSLRTPRVRTA